MQLAAPSCMERRRDRLVRLIGGFKVVKGITLLLIGLTLIEARDAAWLHRYLDVGHERIRHVVGLGTGSVAYAGLFLVEGVGLLMRKVWAEYLTIAITASFIPLEIYELARKPTMPRVV